METIINPHSLKMDVYTGLPLETKLIGVQPRNPTHLHWRTKCRQEARDYSLRHMIHLYRLLRKITSMTNLA